MPTISLQNMSEEYEFVRVSEQNLADFRFLAKDAFGTELTADEAAALFDTRGTGKEYIGYIAYSRETCEPAAFYGVFPCFVEFDGQSFLAAQSGSTMTHSKHRKRGLFFEAGVRTLDLAREEGLHFVYGFPNRFSYQGLMKLGWKHDGNLNSYHMFVPTLPLGSLANKFTFLVPLYRSWFRFITSRWRVDSYPFVSSASSEGIGSVRRDESSLKYKPEADNRLMIRSGNSTVWINQQQGRIGIGDIDFASGADFKTAMRFVKFICFLTGSFHLRTYVSPGSRLDLLLKENGYRGRSAVAICYKDLSNKLPVSNFKYVYGDFDTF